MSEYAFLPNNNPALMLVVECIEPDGSVTPDLAPIAAWVIDINRSRRNSGAGDSFVAIPVGIEDRAWANDTAIVYDKLSDEWHEQGVQSGKGLDSLTKYLNERKVKHESD